MALDYRVDGQGSIPVGGVGISLHSFLSRRPGVHSASYKMSTATFSGLKAAECRTSLHSSSLCRGCVYVDTCSHIPRVSSWPVIGIGPTFTFFFTKRQFIAFTVKQNTDKCNTNRLVLGEICS